MAYFSKEPFTSITEYFNVSEEFLQNLRDDSSLHEVYKEKIKLFFDLNRAECIFNRKAQFALAEETCMGLKNITIYEAEWL